MMYKVATIRQKSPLAYTTVSFSLPYCDWCRLEKSKEWEVFESLLEEIQSVYNETEMEKDTLQSINNTLKRIENIISNFSEKEILINGTVISRQENQN